MRRYHNNNSLRSEVPFGFILLIILSIIIGITICITNHFNNKKIQQEIVTSTKYHTKYDSVLSLLNQERFFSDSLKNIKPDTVWFEKPKVKPIKKDSTIIKADTTQKIPI